MNIEIDIDGLHCDGKLVMVWADPSDLPSRERLINEFEVPEFYDDEEIDELENKIEELEDKIEELKDTIDGLESDNDYLEEKIEKLKERLKQCKNRTELK